MPGIFGVALRGYGMLKKGKKAYNTIKSVKPNVPKTKSEKLKSKLAIAKQKTKASQARLDQTVFDIKQKSKGRGGFAAGGQARRKEKLLDKLGATDKEKEFFLIKGGDVSKEFKKKRKGKN